LIEIRLLSIDILQKKQKTSSFPNFFLENKRWFFDEGLGLSEVKDSERLLLLFKIGKTDVTCSLGNKMIIIPQNADGYINVKMEYEDGLGGTTERATYSKIQAYVEGKYGFKVHTAYIAEVKRSLGLPMYDAPNAVDELKHPYKPAPAHKVEAVKDASKHFEVI